MGWLPTKCCIWDEYHLNHLSGKRVSAYVSWDVSVSD